MAALDLDEDGLLDLAATEGGTTRLYRNTGAGVFALVGSVAVGLFIELSTIWVPTELKTVGALFLLIIVPMRLVMTAANLTNQDKILFWQ